MSEFIFGVCTGFDDKDRLLKAKAAGAQYYEVSFGGLSKATEDEIKEFYDFTKSEAVPCLASNGMFPGEMKLVGPDVDYFVIDEYLDKTAARLAFLGGKTVILGSGGARRCPDDFSFDTATEQFVQLCAEHVAPYMKKYGLTCAIEPLRSGECNLITTAKRGFEICKAANVPEVKLLIDLYHFDMENEERESILDYKGYIQHIHVASATNERKYPKPDDGTDYKNFIDLLRAIDYGPKLISLEGRCTDFYEEAKTAFEVLKSL